VALQIKLVLKRPSFRQKCVLGEVVRSLEELIAMGKMYVVRSA